MYKYTMGLEWHGGDMLKCGAVVLFDDRTLIGSVVSMVNTGTDYILHIKQPSGRIRIRSLNVSGAHNGIMLIGGDDYKIMKRLFFVEHPKDGHYFYPAVLTYKMNEQIEVFFPDFSASTCGATEADALISAQKLLRKLISCSLEKNAYHVPNPTPLKSLSPNKHQRTVLVDVTLPKTQLSPKSSLSI